MSANPTDLVLGLDVGTTAAKASVFSLDGRVRLTAQREYPLLSPQPGWQVQDPATIARGVLDAMADAVAQAGSGRVLAVSVSTAMHGLVGLDASLGPVTDLMTWADSRATEQAKRLARGAAGERLHRQSGTPVHAMSPLVKLVWLAENEPDLLARTPHWVGLKDWVLAVLTGRVVTELSSASGSGMLELATGEWSDEALELTGVRLAQLPPVLDTTATLALGLVAAKATGLPDGTPVVVGAGDGPLGNLGTGAMRQGSRACRSAPAARCGWSSSSLRSRRGCSATRSPATCGCVAARSATAAWCSAGSPAPTPPGSRTPRPARSPRRCRPARTGSR